MEYYFNKIMEKIHFNYTINTCFASRIFGIMALPSMVFFIYKFIEIAWPRIRKFKDSLTKSENYFLKIIFVLSSLLCVYISYNTTLFSMPTYKEGLVEFDSLYTCDTGTLSARNVWMNISHIENDVRQPYFGIMSLPFSVPAHIIGEFCFFLNEGTEYFTILMIMQTMMIAVALVLIARMLNIKEENKKWLYIVFFTCFSSIIFSLILEQYAISFFYLILGLYLGFNLNDEKEINYGYIGAVGTMLTSGIIFPLISKFRYTFKPKFTEIKQWIKNVAKCFVAYLSIGIVSGKLDEALDFSRVLNLAGDFGGEKIGFIEKLQQFLEFVKSMFFGTNGEAGTRYYYPAYQLNIPTTFSYIGIIILILVTISVILNKKNKLSIISYLWILFSFVITVVVGWGAQENGMILYGLYFGWAYIISIYMLFDYLFEKVLKNRKIFICSIVLFSSSTMILSLIELYKIFRFAIMYY